MNAHPAHFPQEQDVQPVGLWHPLVKFPEFLSLSQTQRRLAHRAKREALKWEREGKLKFYRECKRESDRLWREARAHVLMARSYYEQLKVMR